MRNNNTDYLYYRQLYSNQYYGRKCHIEVILSNGNIRYLYFDRYRHIKLTDKLKYATKFTRKPKNYEQYVAYIKRMYKDALVNYVVTIEVKNK